MSKFFLLFITIIGCYSFNVQAQITLAGWDFSTVTQSGPSPMPASVNDINITAGALERGPGVSAWASTSTGAANYQAFGGYPFNNTNFTNAVNAGQYYTFSVKANTGHALSLEQISFSVRQPNGFASGGTLLLQYAFDAFTFTDIQSYPITFLNTTSVSATLSGITALQNVGSGTTVTFRIVAWGGSAANPGSGVYMYNVNAGTANDLVVSGTVSNVLPLQLISFDGHATENKKTLLSWETADEKNISGYELQRSVNGINYMPISFLQAKNETGNDIQQYTYTDAFVSASAVYYRLRIVEDDLAYSYSPTIAIKIADAYNPLRLYPNPANNILYLSAAVSENAEISIIDLSGKVWIHSTLSQADASINIARLPTGHYTLLRTTGEKTESYPFLKS